MQEKAIALFNTVADNEDELTFSKGDVLTILDQDTEYEDWWLCELNGETGIAPVNRLKIIEFPRISEPISGNVCNRAEDYYDIPVQESFEKIQESFKNDEIYSLPSNLKRENSYSELDPRTKNSTLVRNLEQNTILRNPNLSISANNSEKSVNTISPNSILPNSISPQSISPNSGSSNNSTTTSHIISPRNSHPSITRSISTTSSKSSFNSNSSSTQTSSGPESRLRQSNSSINDNSSRCSSHCPSSKRSSLVYYSSTFLPQHETLEELLTLEQNFRNSCGELLVRVKPDWRSSEKFTKNLSFFKNQSTKVKNDLISYYELVKHVYRGNGRENPRNKINFRSATTQVYKQLKILANDKESICEAVGELDKSGWNLLELVKSGSVKRCYTSVSSFGSTDWLDSVILTARASIDDISDTSKIIHKFQNQLFSVEEEVEDFRVSGVVEGFDSKIMTEIMKKRPLPETPSMANLRKSVNSLNLKNQGKGNASEHESQDSVRSMKTTRFSIKTTDFVSKTDNFMVNNALSDSNSPSNSNSSDSSFEKHDKSSSSGTSGFDDYDEIEPNNIYSEIEKKAPNHPIEVISQELLAMDSINSLHLGPASLFELLKPLIVEAHGLMQKSKVSTNCGSKKRKEEIVRKLSEQLSLLVAEMKKFTISYQRVMESGDGGDISLLDISIDDFVVESVASICGYGKKLVSWI